MRAQARTLRRQVAGDHGPEVRIHQRERSRRTTQPLRVSAKQGLESRTVRVTPEVEPPYTLVQNDLRREPVSNVADLLIQLATGDKKDRKLSRRDHARGTPW